MGEEKKKPYDDLPKANAVPFFFQGRDCVILLKSEYDNIIDALVVYHAHVVSAAGDAKMVISFDKFKKMIEEEDREKKDE